MKKTLRLMGLCALAVLALAGCKKDDQTAGKTSVKATISQLKGGTKTGVNAGNCMEAVERAMIYISEHFTENIAKGMKRDEALNSAYTLVSAKKRLRKEIAENQQIKQAVLTGIKKTGEKGYKHVNEVERTAEGLKDIGFIHWIIHPN